MVMMMMIERNHDTYPFYDKMEEVDQVGEVDLDLGLVEWMIGVGNAEYSVVDDIADGQGSSDIIVKTKTGGQGSSNKNVKTKTGGQGSSDKNVKTKTDGQGSSDKNVKAKTNGQGSSDKNIKTKTGDLGSSDKNVKAKTDGQGSSEKNIKAKTDSQGSSDKNIKDKTDGQGSSDKNIMAKTDGQGSSEKNVKARTDHEESFNANIKTKIANESDDNSTDLNPKTCNKQGSMNDIENKKDQIPVKKSTPSTFSKTKTEGKSDLAHVKSQTKDFKVVKKSLTPIYTSTPISTREKTNQAPVTKVISQNKSLRGQSPNMSSPKKASFAGKKPVKKNDDDDAAELSMIFALSSENVDTLKSSNSTKTTPRNTVGNQNEKKTPSVTGRAVVSKHPIQSLKNMTTPSPSTSKAAPISTNAKLISTKIESKPHALTDGGINQSKLKPTNLSSRSNATNSLKTDLSIQSRQIQYLIDKRTNSNVQLQSEEIKQTEQSQQIKAESHHKPQALGNAHSKTISVTVPQAKTSMAKEPVTTATDFSKKQVVTGMSTNLKMNQLETVVTSKQVTPVSTSRKSSTGNTSHTNQQPKIISSASSVVTCTHPKTAPASTLHKDKVTKQEVSSQISSTESKQIKTVGVTSLDSLKNQGVNPSLRKIKPNESKSIGSATADKQYKNQGRVSSPCCIADLMATSPQRDEDNELENEVMYDDEFAVNVTKASAGNITAHTSNQDSLKVKDQHVNKKVNTETNINKENAVLPKTKRENNVTSEEPPTKKLKVDGTPTSATIMKDSTSAPQTTKTAPVKTSGGKRIVRRFHRHSQTTVKQFKSKMAQCLIYIPTLDSPLKIKENACVQTQDAPKNRPAVFYMSQLPAAIKADVFEIVSSFDITSDVGRVFKPKNPCTYGICIGQITQSEIDKSMFRENIIKQAAHYRVHFMGQEGVIDLFYSHMQPFLEAVTQIRKTKIGPRYLPVTFFKVLKDHEQYPKHPVPYVRATVVFDQNFASSAYLATVRAQVWNRPKVEETMSVHNMPGGIPVDFLNQVIPEVLTIEVESLKENTKQFTLDGSRVLLDVNRKTGDHIPKLFSQVYINGHCLVITRGRTNATHSPNLKEILQRQREFTTCESSSQSFKELKAKPRNINLTSNTKNGSGADEVVDMVMQVDDVPDADRVLVGRSGAWKGLNTVERLNKFGPLNPAQYLPETPRQDLSDISDGSDIGQGQGPVSPEKIKARGRQPASQQRRKIRGTKMIKRSQTALSRLEPNKQTLGGGAPTKTPLTTPGVERTTEKSIHSRSPRAESKHSHGSTSGRRPAQVANSKSPSRHTERRSSVQDETPQRRPDDLRNLISARVPISHEKEKRIVPLTKRVTRKLLTPGSRRSEARKSRMSLLVSRDTPRQGKSSSSVRRRNLSSSERQTGGSDRFKRLVEEKLRNFDLMDAGDSRDVKLQQSTNRDRSRQEANRSPRTGGRRGGSVDRGRVRRSLEPIRTVNSRPIRDISPLMSRPMRARSRSPLVRRRRSTSIDRGRRRGLSREDVFSQREKEIEGVGRNAHTPDRLSSSGRKVYMPHHGSRSPSGKRPFGRRGLSSLSPIRIYDDESRYGSRTMTNPTALNNSSLIQTVDTRGRNDLRKHLSNVQQAGNLVSVSTAGPTAGASSSNEGISNQEREVLQEFFKHLLATSSDSPKSGSDSVSHVGQDQRHQQHHHHNQGGASSSVMDGRAPHYAHQHHTDARWGSVDNAGGARPSSMPMGAPIPPPIPPPVVPPLHSVQHTEKISHLESLAKQLAADIQRQQPAQDSSHTKSSIAQFSQPPPSSSSSQQPPTDISGGMWAAPASMPLQQPSSTMFTSPATLTTHAPRMVPPPWRPTLPGNQVQNPFLSIFTPPIRQFGNALFNLTSQPQVKLPVAPPIRQLGNALFNLTSQPQVTVPVAPPIRQVANTLFNLASQPQNKGTETKLNPHGNFF